ncbi:hypothetical protein M422DRAFT_259753 [Sphaerobolus stellatus SS14]|uniref:Unplaced genomic scaffold SPHSTscaffold_92, whole genome shotgun sequence n=1 Tax=Sphaerobolus stellatus (strain SS14) TaxID=990650 RepID=A0A0C9US71_SPHS4|nr:hypothetical protein M422DRAFT_259753 [Sphaerobolus stellatus SS14]
MASSTIFGNFTVIDPEIVTAPNNGRLTYAIYNTSVYTDDLQSAFPAIIRCFLPSGASPLPNNTTVFLYGKISAPAAQIFLIEAINIFPYPGEVTDPNYGAVPAFAPRISILGHTSGGVTTTYEGCRVFRVLSAAWVRGQLQATNFMAYFDNSFRWKKTNTPNSGSPVYILGPLVGRHQETQFPLINIEDITFNAGSRLDQAATTRQRSTFMPKVHMLSMNSTNNPDGNSTNTSNTSSKGSESDPIHVSSGSSNNSSISDESPPVSSRTRARTTEIPVAATTNIVVNTQDTNAPTQGPENNVTPSFEISSEYGNSAHLPPHVSYGGGNSQAPQIFANDVNIRRPTPYPYGALANLMGPTKTPGTSLNIANDAKIIDRPSTPFKPQREGIHAEEMRLLNNGIAESEHLLAKDILRIRAELGLDNTASANGNGTVRPQDTLLNHGTNTAQAGDSSDTEESATSSRVKPVRSAKRGRPAKKTSAKDPPVKRNRRIAQIQQESLASGVTSETSSSQ